VLRDRLRCFAGVAGAIVALGLAPLALLSASADGNTGHHCMPGSTVKNYCQSVCQPPDVVGEHVRPAIRDILRSGCSVGRLTCVISASGSAVFHRNRDCGAWRWRGGQTWWRCQRPTSWAATSGSSSPGAGGPHPCDPSGVVIAQNPGPGGELPAGTPVDLTVAYRPHP
jgi:hypothetical protein